MHFMRGMSFCSKIAGNKLSSTQTHHIALNHNADQILCDFYKVPCTIYSTPFLIILWEITSERKQPVVKISKITVDAVAESRRHRKRRFDPVDSVKATHHVFTYPLPRNHEKKNHGRTTIHVTE